MYNFPEYNNLRCLMMPYIQGDSSSLPKQYRPYADFVDTYAVEPGEIGYLTIDESPVEAGKPHRGDRAKYGRALHTEAGCDGGIYMWAMPLWGGRPNVTLDWDTRVLLCNNIDDSCAIWDAEETDTSLDGDIGDKAYKYPYDTARMLKAGEVADIGILTPHESLPLSATKRQFIRIVSSGVHGREPYFTINPKVAA